MKRERRASAECVDLREWREREREERTKREQHLDDQSTWSREGSNESVHAREREKNQLDGHIINMASPTRMSGRERERERERK